ncbi:hypothetical protein [Flavobacterium sp. 3HN19-14]|uniref:hypothetical protein n=1 Tax=Flavobacterium sp. 3HN19-14 TaxID=3448133 RepID=UPI003EE266CC
MKTINTILGKTIKFEELDTSKNWILDFPNKNWCLTIIADEKNKNYFDEIIRKSIEKNVGYICAVGKQHDVIHSMADDEIQFREVDIEDFFLPKHLIITISDEDFENGLWSSIYLSQNPETEIKEIIILDLTKTAFKKTFNLIEKFHNGYLPNSASR